MHWVGAWDTAPGFTGASFADQTLRLVITPQIGGRVLRVRLTNRFGSRPLRLDRVTIGLRSSGAGLVPGSNRPVYFASRRRLVVGAGRDAISDRVRLAFRAFQDLAVSIYARKATGPSTGHYFSLETSYLAGGDRSDDGRAAPFAGAPLASWPFLDGLDVLAPRRNGAVVAFGDSLTDGFPGAGGRNRRYPDFLARRLSRARAGMSVLNAGLVGDGLVGRPPFPGALARLSHDVPARAGVSDVIVLQGTNDLRVTRAPAAAVISGLERVVAALERRRLNVLLGTVIPFGPRANDQREVVNRWIRKREAVDFDAAVHDPADRSRIRPRYDSGDGIHPNAAGYRRMAAAVDLRRLEGPRCRR